MIGRFIIVLSLVASGIWIKRLLKKADKESLKNLNNWADEMVANALGKKLNVSMNEILYAIHNTQNSELIIKIQDILDSVILSFTKQTPSIISLCLEIKYRDETSYSLTTEKNWDELPGIVREEFLRKGSKIVQLPWHFDK